jgi:hypothetical protein
MRVTKSHCGVQRKMVFREALVTLSPEASFRATSAVTLRQNSKNHFFPSHRMALFVATTSARRAVVRLAGEPCG